MVMRRELLMHLMMFTISYGVFLGYFYYQNPGRSAAPAAMKIQQAMVSVGSELLSPAARSQAPATQRPVLAPAVAVPVGNSGARTQVAAIPVPAAETFVPDYASPQAQVTSLERAAQFDEHAGNRLNAVASLRQQAAVGDADGSILDALRAATMDEDPAVRSAAQSAYNEVVSLKQVR